MLRHRLILLVALVIAMGFLWLRGAFVGMTAAITGAAAPAPLPAPAEGLAVATFASGCFWCTEADFDGIPGVIATTAGYTGGAEANPTYSQVASGRTGHAEAVQVLYDPRVVSYEQLLEAYWKNVDPFTADGQFCDRGRQYRPEIFVHDDHQRHAAESSSAAVQARLGQPVAVAISPMATFYPAEQYLQDYHQKHPIQYGFYRDGCGRDDRLAEIWSALPAH